MSLAGGRNDQKADPAMQDLADRAETLHLAAQEALFAAREGDARKLAERIERLLPMQVQFAQAYRTWLVGRPPPPGESMST